MKKNFVGKSILSGILGAALFASAPAQSAEQWSMATAWPGGVILEKDVGGFNQLVDTLTDGRIKITAFPGGMLGKALKVTDSVKSSVAQAGHTWMGYDWGIDKTTVLFGNMAGGLNPEEMMMWLFQAGGEQLWEEYRMKEFGVVSIACGIFPTEIFLHSNKRVQNLADFKGLKMRTAGAWAEIASGLGASTVILPGAEVYPALERGVVDAAEWGSPSGNVPIGFHKIAKYIIMPGVHQPSATQECQFNADAWKRISERDRKAIRLAARLNALESWSRYAYEDIAALDVFDKAGNEIVQLDEEFIKAANEAADAWADKQASENEWFKKVLENRRAFQKAMAQWPRFRFAMGKR